MAPILSETYKHVLQELESFANLQNFHRAMAYAADWISRLKELHEPNIRPEIVCLCGSTKFWRDFQRVALEETLAGNIVLSIGAASGTDEQHFGNLPREEYDRVKQLLDNLHLQKIGLADRVRILNIGGYIGGYMGESTRKELEYARRRQKRIQFEQDPGAPLVYPESSE